MSKFLLPQQRSLEGFKDQGWQIDTVVKPSQVAEGAGNGRFSEVDIPKGTKVIIKKLIPMSAVSKLVDLPGNSTVTFTSEEELESFISKATEEGGHSREQVIDLYENFVWGLDENRACLNISTWSVNHGDGIGMGQVELNFEMINGEEYCVGTTLEEGVTKGAEFTNDYRRFIIPAFYTEYCKKNNITDVRSLVLSIVDAGK